MAKHHLIASKSTGSMIVEAALALAKLPHEVEMIPYVEPVRSGTGCWRSIRWGRCRRCCCRTGA
jgi:hypothetical protein